MKFIEVKDGICIAVKKIEAITMLTELTCLIYTESGNNYECNFPYKVLIDILESSKDTQQEVNEKMLGHLKFATAFAG